MNWLKRLFCKESTGSYLLEYRHSGYPRKYFLNRFAEIKRRYRIVHSRYHYVPHITIAGPISTKNERGLIRVIEHIIFSHSHKFHEPGNLIRTGKYIKFDTAIGGKVLGIEVVPPKSLVELKNELELAINHVQDSQCQTYKKNIWHTTLWNMKNNDNFNEHKFQKIWKNTSGSPQEMKFIFDRVTLLKDAKILKEFDLVNLKTHSRTKSLDNNLRYKSYIKIKTELESKGESFEY